MPRFNIKKNNKKTAGFTIIETMIAISLFLVVVMIGMGALLNASLIHTKSQDMRSIMDNLSFIMEDMSRNLRTGYDYHCSNNLSLSDIGIPFSPLSCSNGGVIIAFEPSSGNPDNKDQWIYKIESNNISKSINGGTTWTQLNSSEISLDANSGFWVTGAESSDTLQPFAIIKLSGAITYKDISTPFSLETAVSQRLIDTSP